MTNRPLALTLSLAALFGAAPALAAPGLGGAASGANVEEGEIGVLTRWDRLVGDDLGGEDVLRGELGYGVTDRFGVTLAADFVRVPGEGRDADAVAIEGVHELGTLGSIDLAMKAEYVAVLQGADATALSLLLEHESGPVAVLVDFVAAKDLAGGEPVTFGYAVLADYSASDNLRLGFEAFGDLGSTGDFLVDDAHFAGPAATLAVGDSLEATLGFLIPLSDYEADGMVRVSLGAAF